MRRAERSKIASRDSKVRVEPRWSCSWEGIDLDMDAMKGVEEVDVKALQRLADAPAYTGAIPLAIFDAAMKQFGDECAIAANFFDRSVGRPGISLATCD